MSDEDPSVVGGLWDAATAGVEAIGDVAGAGIDLARAGGEAVLGGAAHVDAGLLEAVGAEGLAADIRSGADALQDMAGDNVTEAGGELSDAGHQVFGNAGEALLDAAESAGSAALDLGGSALDLGAAGVDAGIGAVGQVDAGFAEAFGAEELAGDMRAGADAYQEDAWANLEQAEQGAEDAYNEF